LFDTLIETKVEPFVAICHEIGGDCSKIATLTENPFRQVQSILESAETGFKPIHEDFIKMVKPITFSVEQAQANRDKEGLHYYHQSSFSFLIPMTLWITYDTAQAVGYVKETRAEGQKYVDKVLKKPNLKDPTPKETHQKWLTAMVDLFDSLAAFVEENYPNGLQWKIDPNAEAKDDTEQTGTVELKKGNWIFDKYKNGKNVALDENKTGMKQGVLIVNSQTSEFNITPKIKAVTMEKCERCKLVVQDLLSAVNVMNCKNIKLFVNGTVPTITVEHSSSVEVWMTVEAIRANPDIVTSNVTEVNLMMPKTESAKDFSEVPIPIQFVTKITGTYGSFKTQTEPVKYF